MKKIILPFFIFIGVVYCCWMSMIWMQWAYIETDVDNFNSLFEALHAIRMRSILTLFSLSITICLMVYYSLKLICKIKKMLSHTAL